MKRKYKIQFLGLVYLFHCICGASPERFPGLKEGGVKSQECRIRTEREDETAC